MTTEAASRPAKNKYGAKHKKRRCVACGKKFWSAYRLQTTCGDPECKEKARKIYNQVIIQRRRAARDKKPVQTCPYCGVEFVPKRDAQVTCGSSECAYQRHIEQKAIYRAEIREGKRPKPACMIYRRKAPTNDEDNWFPDLPRVIRRCLKCGKDFETDVNWICDPCHEKNAEIYVP